MPGISLCGTCLCLDSDTARAAGQSQEEKVPVPPLSRPAWPQHLLAAGAVAGQPPGVWGPARPCPRGCAGRGGGCCHAGGRRVQMPYPPRGSRVLAVAAAGFGLRPPRLPPAPGLGWLRKAASRSAPGSARAHSPHGWHGLGSPSQPPPAAVHPVVLGGRMGPRGGCAPVALSCSHGAAAVVWPAGKSSAAARHGWLGTSRVGAGAAGPGRGGAAGKGCGSVLEHLARALRLRGVTAPSVAVRGQRGEGPPPGPPGSCSQAVPPWPGGAVPGVCCAVLCGWHRPGSRPCPLVAGARCGAAGGGRWPPAPGLTEPRSCSEWVPWGRCRAQPGSALWGCPALAPSPHHRAPLPHGTRSPGPYL